MMVLRALCEDQAQALGEAESSTPIGLEHRPSIPPVRVFVLAIVDGAVRSQQRQLLL